MKSIFLIVAVMALVSCQETPVTGTVASVESTDTRYGMEHNRKDIEVMTYDGCQYIGHFAGSHTDWGTHKGNCNNPIHDKAK